MSKNSIYKKVYESGEITEENIYEILNGYYAKKYGGSIDVGRKLTRHVIKSGGETIIFALSGTPPKGYAIYVPEMQYLKFLDVRGNSIKEFESVNLA